LGGVSMCKMETWLLEDYAEGLLDVAETTLLEAHLAGCEACRRELAHIKLLFWELESLRRETVTVPDTVQKLETVVLDEWLHGRESWIQQAGSALRRGAKQSKTWVPRVPGAEKVAALAGEASVRTVKWVGGKTVQLLKRKLQPVETGKQLLSVLTGGDR
jgi:anti-sigma factor RsiW